jgi:hypothetical protein
VLPLLRGQRSPEEVSQCGSAGARHRAHDDHPFVPELLNKPTGCFDVLDVFDQHDPHRPDAVLVFLDHFLAIHYFFFIGRYLLKDTMASWSRGLVLKL